MRNFTLSRTVARDISVERDRLERTASSVESEDADTAVTRDDSIDDRGLPAAEPVVAVPTRAEDARDRADLPADSG